MATKQYEVKIYSPSPLLKTPEDLCRHLEDWLLNNIQPYQRIAHVEAGGGASVFILEARD